LVQYRTYRHNGGWNANDACEPLSFGSKPLSLVRLSVVVGLSVAVLMAGLGKASSQDFPNRFVQRFGVQPKPRPDATVTPAIEATSPLGQALAACEKDATAQEPFALPGLKNEVTLDRCYKGRAHLVCVFNALIAEANALTESYTKIVEAKYPDLNSVEGICKLNRDALATDIGGSEDFTKRFVALKAQYESASKCAGSVKQAFRDVVLADHGATAGNPQIHDRFDRQRRQPGLAGAKSDRRARGQDRDLQEGNEDHRQDSSDDVHQGQG
jgi:hypothetical protein